MKLKYLALCLPLVVGSGLATADTDFAAVNDALKKNACLACHAIDSKVVGPAYKEIAAASKDDAAKAEVLKTHIKSGSSGVWGPIPMPPNPNISDDDLTLIVDWLMAGAPH
ncbi:c-type cytochrome [Paenalcaligenes niemegkensis]|uniref:c-type cytochrome n=1 Tax=Paenalcaligenes niemegkensis TaxID=2895469 RepID=UPI001EE80838|nr:c-type cytochrome [Paenalcaligenes niemegkensis]MCQ9616320.1 c-type cytochrome [Paenalcaligenes niemegkensis]